MNLFIRKIYQRSLPIAIGLMIPMCMLAKTTRVTSPNGKLVVVLNTAKGNIGYQVLQNNKLVYTLDSISMTIDGRNISVANPKVGKVVKVSNTIRPTVPLKFSTINDCYNQVIVSLGNHQLELRVMNNAVAYRFLSNQHNKYIEVFDDHFVLRAANNFTVHRQTSPDNFNTSYEEKYVHSNINEWAQSNRRVSTSPLLLSRDDDTQLLIGESDVDDYPHQFLLPRNGAIVPTYPKMPLKWEPSGDRGEKITKEAAFIAKKEGKCTFPWRWVVVTDSKGLIEQTVPVQLARKSVLNDVSWIRPGKVSWEWWNGSSPYGPDVNFKIGCNYDTYAYYADFAAKYGIQYILLDEGWATSTRDPFNANDQMRLKELISYCKSKGVGIFLWLSWLTVEQHFDLFKKYAEWGIEGVKIDFMDHADQWMTNYYKRVAKEAAKYHLMVDFHGAFTPAGLEYEYPNVMSYEGVLGLEQMENCKPENTLYLPFIRNAVGAADFTPGGMINMQPDRYRGCRPNSAALGTRAFQMALYVVLESGIQMLADSPTRYYQEDDCTSYIASVPTTWDETRALAACAGKYLIVARRKGNEWFIGGICDGEKDQRTFQVPLDFLKGNYDLTAYQDGVNANYQAMHYNKTSKTVSGKDVLNITMMRNGGFAARITPKK